MTTIKELMNARIIAKFTASIVLIGGGIVLAITIIYQIPLHNGHKELLIMFISGSMGFLFASMEGFNN